MDDLLVCYAATPGAYAQMAAASIYTLVRGNPGIRVRLIEAQENQYPHGIKAAALPATYEFKRLGIEWVLFLDADTEVTGPLKDLNLQGDFCARIGTAFHANGWVDSASFSKLLTHFGAPPTALGFNAGAFACRADVALELSMKWGDMIQKVRVSGQDDPQRQPGRRQWWMADQYALAILVGKSDWDVRTWSAEEHSFGWEGGPKGVIHHFGTSRWRSPI